MTRSKNQAVRNAAGGYSPFTNPPTLVPVYIPKGSRPRVPSQAPMQPVPTPSTAPAKANVMRPTVIGGSVDNYVGQVMTLAANKRRKRSAFSSTTPQALQKNAGKQELRYLESLLHPERQIPVGIPDDFSYPFCPMSLVSKLAVTTDASGNLYVLVQPYIKSHFQQATSTAGAWNGPTYQDADQYTAMTTTIRSYRPVSLSATFTCTLPALTASGEALVGIYGDPTNALIGQQVTKVQQACIEWERCGLNSSAGCRAIWFPRSPADRLYVWPAQAPIQQGQGEGDPSNATIGSANILFAFTGLPASTNIGFVETTLNIEGIPLIGDNFLTKVKSHKNTQIMDMVANVVSSSSQITPYESGKAVSRGSNADSWLSYLERGVDTAVTVGSLLSKLPVF